MRFFRRRVVWGADTRRQARSLARDADHLVRKIDEGTRYLLVTNGATLVAVISGSGTAWPTEQLRGVFMLLIVGFTYSLALNVLVWVFSLLATQSVLTLKAALDEGGYTPQSWAAWTNSNISLKVWFFLASVDVAIIVVTALSVGRLFTGHVFITPQGLVPVP